MTTALLLVAIGMACRLLIAFALPYDFSQALPIAAIALYAAAKLPRRQALMVPLAIFVLSDLIIDLNHGFLFYWPSRLVTYAYFVGVALAGTRMPKRVPLGARVLAAAAGSTGFFLVSNFAVWWGGEGFGYASSWDGLMSCYTAGLLFYRNMIVADVVGTIALFGLDGLRVPHNAAEPEIG